MPRTQLALRLQAQGGRIGEWEGVGRSHRLRPRQTAVAIKSQGQGWGEVRTVSRPQSSQWAAVEGTLEPCRRQPSLFLELPHSPTGPRPGGLEWGRGRERQESASYLILHLMTTIPLTVG